MDPITYEIPVSGHPATFRVSENAAGRFEVRDGGSLVATTATLAEAERFLHEHARARAVAARDELLRTLMRCFAAIEALGAGVRGLDAFEKKS